MSTSTPTANYSYSSIPTAFCLGLVPHSYYLVRLMLATKGPSSLAMPRTNLDTWKGKLPQELWNHLARVRGAHLNSMEVFPLFAAAMVAGNVAGLPVSDLNNTALSFFSARVVYMTLYAGVRADKLAPMRAVAYALSIAVPILALVRAGRASSTLEL